MVRGKKRRLTLWEYIRRENTARQVREQRAREVVVALAVAAAAAAAAAASASDAADASSAASSSAASELSPAAVEAIVQNMTKTQRGLFNKVWKTRERLFLNKQQIDDAGAEAVAEALKVSTLLILELETNQIGEGGARAIAEALKVNTPLTTLMLHQNQIGYAGALAIAEALEVNDTLIYLGLNANQIGAAGAQAIAEALKVNRGLIQLFLHENQIGDAGAQAIAEALKVNKTLWRLNLDKNRIGDAGAQAIAETLKVNKMLIELSLRWNCIGNRGSQALDEARKVNGFRELFSELQINPLVFSWLPRVATAEDLQTVFCLLTSGLELENQSASLPALPAEIADIIMEDAHYWQGVQHTRGNEFFEDKNHPPLSVTVPRDVTGSPIRMKAIQVIREMQFPDTTLGVCFELSVRDGRGVARYQCAVKPTRIDSSIGLVLLRPGSHPIFEQLREGWEVLLQPSVYGMQVGIESLTLAYI